MLSIDKMKELAQKEMRVEKELAKVKFDKDLAKYRDKLSKVKPKLMEYIEKRIYIGIKNNSKIGLYTRHVDDMFKPIIDYGDNLLYYLADPALEPYDAYTTALKELADDVRQELFDAGVMAIIPSGNGCICLEV
jgi:hypothetical protein